MPAPQAASLRERFLVTGLDPATDYYFAIKARDDVPLWSPLSNTARGTTLPLLPAAPQDLVAETLSDTAIRLHWTDLATNETLYRIQRQSPTDPQFALADTMIGSFTGTVTYRDGGLTERTSYRYRVRAENAGGHSDWSNEVVQRTRITRPTRLAASAVAPDSVALTWRFPLPDPSDGFRLERRTGSTAYAEIDRPAPADRAFMDAGRQPLTTYIYRLRAAETGDPILSDPSDSAKVTTPDLAPACHVDFTTLDFDTVFVGSSLDRAFLITNTGGGTLTGTLATTVVDGYVRSPASGTGSVPDGITDYVVRTVTMDDGSRWVEALDFLYYQPDANVVRAGTLTRAGRLRWNYSPGCRNAQPPRRTSTACQFEPVQNQVGVRWDDPYTTPIRR